MSRISLSLLVTLTTMVAVTRAGFRCTLGDWACSASCVTLGQTSGICDSENDCICSEKSIRYLVRLVKYCSSLSIDCLI